MSRNSNELGFYFRSGHQSVLMEVFQIRDQMLRRAVPILEFEWDMRVRNDDIFTLSVQRSVVPVSLDLILRNNSAVSAQFPYLITRSDRGRYVSMGHQYQEFAREGLPIAAIGSIRSRKIVVDSRSVSQDREFTGGADYCIHPGTALRIAAIRLAAPASLNSNYLNSTVSQKMLEPRYRELLTVIMEVSYGCLDAPCEKIPLELKADEMHAKLFANGQAGAVLV